MEITIKKLKFDGTCIECSYVKTEVVNDMNVITERKIKDYREPHEELFKLTKGIKMKNVVAEILQKYMPDEIAPVEISFSGKEENRAATIKTRVVTKYGLAVVTLPKIKYMAEDNRAAAMLTEVCEQLTEEVKDYLAGESEELETLE